MKFQKLGLIGRKQEMKNLNNVLSQAAQGHGSTIILSGEAGIGKTRLLEEFKAQASTFSIYSGAAVQDALQPFMLFSSALEHEIETPLFSVEEHKSFTTVFAVNHAGLLVAQASTEDEELDGDIFAGMLTAVQSFVHDSMGRGEGKAAGLGRLEYGDLKIIIEHSQHIFVTAVFSGLEHQDMKKTIRQTVNTIENEHASILKSWNGSMEEVQPISKVITTLAETKFLVRKDLEGLKLEEERLKIADGVLNLISGLSSSRPALLVLEDLHWADESSLSVLKYVSRNIQNQKIMILATSRPVEGGYLHETMGNIMGHGGTIMPLIGLENKGLGEMLDEIYPGNSFPAEFTGQIIQQCDGNPFFFLELLRQIWVDGNVIQENGKFSLVEQNVAIPASVEDIILKRLASLDSQTMALAEYSSCIGKIFKREDAMAIETVQEPALAIERLIDSGIILSNNGSMEFTHAIFQDVIYSGITGRWKSAYHKHLGEYYESAFDGQSEVIYQLARHFFRSREHDKAFNYCIGAGEKAESAFAAEQALNFYNDAYSLTSKLRDAGQMEDAKKFLPVRLGDLLNFTGQLDNALENYELALLKEDEIRKKASIYRKIAEINYRRGEYEKSRNAGDSGLEILDGQVCVEAERLYSTLGWTFIRTGKHSKALELLDKGLEIATKCNDQEGIANVEHNIGSVQLHKGEYEKAIIHFDKALAIREEINDVWHISSSLNNLGNSYMGLGDMLKALDYYEMSVENSKNIGDNRARSISLTNMGNVLACLGDLNKAMDHYVQSHELKVKFDDKWGISTILENIGTLHFTFGEMDKALEHYQESLAIRDRINDVSGIALSHINIGEAYHYTDEPAKAHEHYIQALEIATEIDEKWLVIVANYRIAEALLALGNMADAHKYVNLALKTSIKTNSKSEEARSRQALANIHKAEGNYKLALAEFELAKIIYDETLEKGEQAKILYDYALLHLEMDETETAKQELEQALELFHEAGGTFFADKCQKTLDEID